MAFFVGSPLGIGVPILNLLLAWQHPCFAGGALPQRTRCPRLTPVPTLAHRGGGPDSLFSWYTSLYSPLISPQESLVSHELDGRYIFLGVHPEGFLASSLSKLLAPFLSSPDSVACRNILWRMNGQWGPQAFHHGYSCQETCLHPGSILPP